ncbi:hypothetical protein V5N11_004045 [Cardamine amara subsp. amara]|uniref:Uncharacterized protein n=1 Tax=Cardamine amara subsp. amara TaxID=228776 RepID=A0ABD1AMD1_CARAN
MEKREPSLIPEWLRSSGHGSGFGSSNQLSSHSDSFNSKNRNSRSRSDVDSVRSPFLERSSSTNSRRGSSNGSTRHAYSSFNVSRSNRDKGLSRERDRVSYSDPWDNDTYFPPGNLLIGKGQEQLRRSNSMTTRKQGNNLAQGHTVGVKNGGRINGYNGDDRLSGPGTLKSYRRIGFDKDFPSLGAEERNGGPDVVGISSPGLSPVRSLSVGNSALNVGEGWTSALAEVPNVIEKSGTGSHANVSSSATSTGPTCRNMAEALVQAPRTVTPPQGYAKAQRLEDRARQLIPVVPSAPKSSVLNSSDKFKTRPVFRSGEAGLASLRNTQQQSSFVFGSFQSNPLSQMKPDTITKLVVLKPVRENGVSAVKESGSPSVQAATSQPPAASSTQPTTSVRRASANMTAAKTAEKKLYLAQTQSRNAFFSALKQNTSSNISSSPTANSSKDLVASDPSNAQAAERDEIMVEKVSEVAEKHSRFESVARPDEKEAEFLKSLGWDENDSEEDEALTEEEIKAFNEQYKKFKPSLVQKLPIIEEATKKITP